MKGFMTLLAVACTLSVAAQQPPPASAYRILSASPQKVRIVVNGEEKEVLTEKM